MTKAITIFLITFALLSCSSSNKSKSLNKVTINKTNNSKQPLGFLEEFDGAKASNWLKEHNLSHSWSEQSIEIKENHYFEVGPLKFPFAIKKLSTTGILELSENDAKYYNPHFKKEPNMKPYLVRAVFSNFGNSLRIHKTKNDLIISQGVLGNPGKPKLLPLIINLSDKPQQLKIILSSAM